MTDEEKEPNTTGTAESGSADRQAEHLAGTGESTGGSSDLGDRIDAATEAVAVQTHELEELDGGEAHGDALGLRSLTDVPVRVTVEVGRARLILAELVRLRAGSLVELDREAHEPADILVNGKVVARGEIVTMEDNYGVRITSLLSE